MTLEETRKFHQAAREILEDDKLQATLEMDVYTLDRAPSAEEIAREDKGVKVCPCKRIMSLRLSNHSIVFCDRV